MYTSEKESPSLLGSLIKIYKFIVGILLLYYAYLAVVWYIKMHFHKKYFIFFWMYSILMLVFVTCLKMPESGKKLEERKKSGYEIWNENMKDYDAARGY